MTDRLDAPGGPIEVWLDQANIVVYARIKFEDGTESELHVESLSMRGAQREVTGYLIEQGYQPAERWDVRADGDHITAMRQFRPVHTEAATP